MHVCTVFLYLNYVSIIKSADVSQGLSKLIFVLATLDAQERKAREEIARKIARAKERAHSYSLLHLWRCNIYIYICECSDIISPERRFNMRVSSHTHPYETLARDATEKVCTFYSIRGTTALSRCRDVSVYAIRNAILHTGVALYVAYSRRDKNWFFPNGYIDTFSSLDSIQLFFAAN